MPKTIWFQKWDLTFGKIPVWYFLFSRVSHEVLLSEQPIRFVPMYNWLHIVHDF